MQSLRSTFSGSQMAFRSSSVSVKPATRQLVQVVEAKRVCDLTGKKRNKANAVSFSNKKNRYFQEPNLQNKKVYWEYGQRWVSMKLCTKAIKTIERNGLDKMAAEAGIDLWKLPFTDARPQRLQYLAENKGKVPVAVNPRAIKNPERIAKSSKQPRVPVYMVNGTIAWVKKGTEDLYMGKEEEVVAPVVEDEERELKINIQE